MCADDLCLINSAHGQLTEGPPPSLWQLGDGHESGFGNLTPFLDASCFERQQEM
jgi:hypothetical protein